MVPHRTATGSPLGASQAIDEIYVNEAFLTRSGGLFVLRGVLLDSDAIT